MTLLIVAANGFPDYTARLVRQLVKDFDGRVEVVATRPDVPIEGMETSLGKPVYWVEPADRKVKWEDLGLKAPDILLLGGFFIPAFWSLARQTRKIGGHVFLASDNNWTGSLRQRLLDPIRHKLFLRRNFSGVMTAGEAGMRYCLNLGYPADRIVPGMYGADPSLFFDGPPLHKRPKTFVYVGQFIERKNVVQLAKAFVALHHRYPDWTLEMYGSGPDHQQIPDHPAIKAYSFVQPTELAHKLRRARCLVLPSKEEHWGVVVHEAALSGCALALSCAVGAGPDFATSENAAIFSPNDQLSIETALCTIASFSDEAWQKAQAVSLARGALFGPQRFSAELRRLVTRVKADGKLVQEARLA